MQTPSYGSRKIESWRCRAKANSGNISGAIVSPPENSTIVASKVRGSRDGEGRVLSEQHLPWTEEQDRPVYILDPKSMEHIHVDPQAHVVSKRPVDRRYAWDYVPYDGPQYRLAARPGVTVHTELLGNEDINGLKCWGQRTTYTFQPGAFQGNQQPVQHTWEVWYAKDLGSDVRIVDHNPDPKAGDQQSDLIDIKYGEPDPSIFSPPAGLLKSSSSIIFQLRGTCNQDFFNNKSQLSY